MIVCEACGMPDPTGGSYCVNPSCGALLPQPARPAPPVAPEPPPAPAAPRLTPMETFGRWMAGLFTGAGRKIAARRNRATADATAVSPAAAEPAAAESASDNAAPDRVATPSAAPPPSALSEHSAKPTEAAADTPVAAEDATVDRKPRRAVAATAALATAAGQRLSAVPQKLSAVPRKLSGVPRKFGAVPRRIAGSWSPPERRRWMPAVGIALLATAVAAGVLAVSQDKTTRNAEPPIEPVPVASPSTTPSEASPSPSAVATSASPIPSATARPSSTRKPTPPTSPRPTKASTKPTTTTPKPSISVYARGKCVWQEGHGWTIAVSVTVTNGSGTSATGTHGYDSHVGGSGTYSLSGSGTSFSGELPPNLGDNPELTDSVVSWSVTVRLSGGGTLTKSGSVSNPC